MKLEQLGGLSAVEIWFAGSGAVPDPGWISLNCHAVPGEYLISQGEKFFRVRLRDRNQMGRLNLEISRGLGLRAQMIHSAPDGSFLVLLWSFPTERIDLGETAIAVPPRVLPRLAKELGLPPEEKAEIILHQLRGDLLLEPGGDGLNPLPSFLVMSQGLDLRNQDVPEDEDSGNASLPEWKPKEGEQFYLHSGSLDLQVEVLEGPDGERMLVLKRFMSRPRRYEDPPLYRLVSAEIQFEVLDKPRAVQHLVAACMERLFHQKDSYLKQWDLYGAQEGECLLRTARDVGAIEIKKIEPLSGGTRIYASKSIPKAVEPGMELQLLSNQPPYLENAAMSYADFEDMLRTNDLGELKKSPVFKVLGREMNWLDVAGTMSGKAGGQGFLVLSMNGEIIQIERRNEARQRVLSGRAAMPVLGPLIEEGAKLPRTRKPPKTPAMSAYVSQKIFPHHPPTLKQREAIEAALNTPDIVLIQGPPGTGKTTVITAILERLNELSDKRKPIRSRVLATGYQHDAVENMISRMTINGLPVPKFTNSPQQNRVNEEAIETWARQISDHVKKQNPELGSLAVLEEWGTSFEAYLAKPSLSGAVHLLRELKDRIGADLVPSALLAEAGILLRELERGQKAGEAGGSPALLRSLRGLRVREISFADDGPEKAADVLAAFEELVPEAPGLDVLRRAARWNQEGPPPFLPELLKFKTEWLVRLSPRPFFRIEKPRQALIELCASTINAVKNRELSGKGREQEILAGFLARVENNPDELRMCLADYSPVLAATCQFAGSGRFSKLIQSHQHRANAGAGRSGQTDFDTVIVDEAARVSPRDLLIPMVKARERIILVGDQRQLPHMVDEQIIRQMEEAAGEEEEAPDPDAVCEPVESLVTRYISQSMFSYLFQRLKALEKQDRITRTITLDQQFRMPRELGELVNRHFYAPYGEGFFSPLGDEFFRHGLPGLENVHAAWLEVPAANGGQAEAGTSWIRLAEARAIVDRVASWIHAPECGSLTFGVISFYKKQAELVERELETKGILTGERLRIGTVDAFQGMEFDVVFLSMVRTGPRNPGTRRPKGVSLYGHLVSVNRLCVAMSRQKKILIVAGDSAMVRRREAVEAVPALKAFYELCQGKGTVLE